MKILIVEDDEAIASAIAGLLRDEGYAVAPVRDGRTALAALRAGGEATGLVLLDMSMPVMNGWEFREEQMRDPALASVPVVVCTADSDAERKAAEVGAVDWLRKPIDPERLLAVVERYVGRPEGFDRA